MGKIITYSIKYGPESSYQLPLGMTLKEAKGFAKDYFPCTKVILVTTVWERTMQMETSLA